MSMSNFYGFIENMEGDVLTLENLKLEVRQSFAKIYSALKARELRTIRQIDALWNLCGNGTLISLNTERIKNIVVSYDNENNLYSEIHNFGLINFDKLSIDNSIFLMEDYIDPGNDHMYSYKCLKDACPEQDSDDSLEISIHHEALKQVIDCPQCVCYVNITPEDARNKFCTCPSQETADDSSSVFTDTSTSETLKGSIHKRENSDIKSNCVFSFNEEKTSDTKLSLNIIKSLDPTQEWLNMIVHETETEPSLAIDLMEHTAIECS